MMFEKVQAILAKQLRLDPAKITPESLSRIRSAMKEKI